MQIAILEDDLSDRLLLHNQLNAALSRLDVETELFFYETAEDFLTAAKTIDFDVCFLDIYMENINGLEAARKLRNMGSQTLIIFLTSSRDHVEESFDVEVTRYMLKPITEDRVQKVLDHCIERLGVLKRSLTFISDRQEKQIRFSDILAVVTENRVIMIYCSKKRIPVSTHTTFNKLTAPLLEDSRFQTASRGMVVNLQHVQKIEGNVLVLTNGETLPVSRSKISELVEAFAAQQFIE